LPHGNLVVEVLSRGNTPGEMAAKRQDYFASGVHIKRLKATGYDGTITLEVFSPH
jgi:hypothetical protein